MSRHQRRMTVLTAVSVCVCVCVCVCGGGGDTDNGKEIRVFNVPPNSPTLRQSDPPSVPTVLDYLKSAVLS